MEYQSNKAAPNRREKQISNLIPRNFTNSFVGNTTMLTETDLQAKYLVQDQVKNLKTQRPTS